MSTLASAHTITSSGLTSQALVVLPSTASRLVLRGSTIGRPCLSYSGGLHPGWAWTSSARAAHREPPATASLSGLPLPPRSVGPRTPTVLRVPRPRRAQWAPLPPRLVGSRTRAPLKEPCTCRARRASRSRQLSGPSLPSARRSAAARIVPPLVRKSLPWSTLSGPLSPPQGICVPLGGSSTLCNPKWQSPREAS